VDHFLLFQYLAENPRLRIRLLDFAPIEIETGVLDGTPDFALTTLGIGVPELVHEVLSQERVGPKLSTAAVRHLERLAAPNARIEAMPMQARKLSAGASLLREWNGETHEVRVLESGFEYRGQRHRSLSAIAREITGTRWSGPAFFGLKDRERNDAA